VSDKAQTRILFVCLGNICRSPIAEGIANELARSKALHVSIDSAGTGNWHVGEAPCENSIRVAQLHNIDISHQKARQIRHNELDTYTYIIALDGSNYHDLQRIGAKNLHKLGDFGFEGKDVPDPYFFKGFEGFETVYSMIEVCVSNLIDKISRVNNNN